jgi:hypothetical protein
VISLSLLWLLCCVGCQVCGNQDSVAAMSQWLRQWKAFSNDPASDFSLNAPRNTAVVHGPVRVTVCVARLPSHLLLSLPLRSPICAVVRGRAGAVRRQPCWLARRSLVML